jgi:hypothetical protein
MRAPSIYAALGLAFVLTFLASSYAQRENPRTGPAVIVSQDANPKPSNSGAGDATSAVPNSADNPGQAAAGRPAGARPGAAATLANPPADGVNSPRMAAPFESQAGIPQSAFFEFLFNNVSALDQIADSDDKAGKHIEAAAWRTHDQRGAGLNDAEGEILQDVALDCLRMLKEQDAKIQALAEKFRAQLNPGTPIQVPAELVQMVENRKAIVRDHIERLREALGDASFNKLDTYVHSSIHGEVIVPKPAPPSAAGKNRKENK